MTNYYPLNGQKSSYAAQLNLKTRHVVLFERVVLN